MRTSPEALLITGAYGTGKSLLAANLADELERRRIRFAAIDLDWLAWFDPGDEPADEERVFLANLRAVVANYRAIRIPWFVLAGSVEDRDQLEAISDAIGLPVRVLRLTVPRYRQSSQSSTVVTASAMRPVFSNVRSAIDPPRSRSTWPTATS